MLIGVGVGVGVGMGVGVGIVNSGMGSSRSRSKRRDGDDRRVTSRALMESLQDSGGAGSLSGTSQIHEYEEMT